MRASSDQREGRQRPRQAHWRSGERTCLVLEDLLVALPLVRAKAIVGATRRLAVVLILVVLADGSSSNRSGRGGWAGDATAATRLLGGAHGSASRVVERVELRAETVRTRLPLAKEELAHDLQPRAREEAANAQHRLLPREQPHKVAHGRVPASGLGPDATLCVQERECESARVGGSAA